MGHIGRPPRAIPVTVVIDRGIIRVEYRDRVTGTLTESHENIAGPCDRSQLPLIIIRGSLTGPGGLAVRGLPSVYTISISGNGNEATVTYTRHERDTRRPRTGSFRVTRADVSVSGDFCGEGDEIPIELEAIGVPTFRAW